MAHLATALRAAIETNLQLCDLADRKHGDLLWATQQSLEIALALAVSQPMHQALLAEITAVIR